LEQCRAAKRELERDNDPKHRGTIEEVAAVLEVDPKSVKKRARDAGGWRLV
jgi:hypothetical protein